MILVALAGLAWFSSILAQVGPQFWWFSLLGGMAAAALLRRAKFSLRWACALPAVALLVGSIPLLTSPVNQHLSAVANGFEARAITATVDFDPDFYSQAGLIVSPKSLAGAGYFSFDSSQVQQLEALDCTRFVISGTARLMPPAEPVSARGQFKARFQELSRVSCDTATFFTAVGNATAWTQERARTAATGISQQSAALVLGLTNGDDSGLTDSIKQKMKLLSLTHLTAVSGTNCTIVLVAVFFLAGALGAGRRGRVVISGLALAGYLVLVGPEPSVLRASVMSVIGLVSVLWGRQKSALSFLGLGVLLLLAVDPSLALSLGFALSASATFGVIWLAPKLMDRLEHFTPKWFATLTSVTIAAQVCCLPILATLQSEFSTLAILANVLVEPLVPLITVLGVLGAVVALVLPPVAVPLFWLASIPAQAIIGLAEWLASAGAVQAAPSQALAVAFAILMLLATVLWVSQLRQTQRIGAALLVTLILGTAVFDLRTSIKNIRFQNSDWFYVACDVGQGDATVIRSEGKVALIDVGREPEPVDKCLKQLGVRHIDLLVLTHFDMDHVGGLSGALRGRSVDLGMLTSFPDERPAAGFIGAQLRHSAERVVHGERGLNGTLGALTWRVLSPHHAGEDSEDSNDGSITMTFEAENFWILTLADLGEKGQMRLVSELGSWFSKPLTAKPLILKVSHHGSADEYSEFMHWLKPRIATISVGADNSYGHPTQRLLRDLQQPQATVLRTDQLGSIAVTIDASGVLGWAASSAG